MHTVPKRLECCVVMFVACMRLRYTMVLWELTKLVSFIKGLRTMAAHAETRPPQVSAWPPWNPSKPPQDRAPR
jgi:hypothetical protein